MTIRYHINSSRNTVIALSGQILTAENIVKFFKELADAPKCNGSMRILVDLRAVQSLYLDLNEINDLVSGLRHLKNPCCTSRCALVARSDLVYGTARQIGLKVREDPFPIGVFRTHAEARLWLLQPLKYKSIKEAGWQSEWL
jgi:hypothetical protein